ncbi:MAG: hypothetical protein R3293_10170 [Candidatus Promineifilaceae bacterium]|nr:hypothetical protein [Candidatus Promineifilaceae bacterium]
MTLLLITAFAVQTGVSSNQFNGFLLLGYGIMWLIMMVYVASLYFRQRNLRRDIELMKRILQEDNEELS